MPLPEIRTVDDLRSALGRYGFPGDRERFEEELAAAIGASPTNGFEGAAAVVRAYRHRVLIRNSPEVMAVLEDARRRKRRVTIVYYFRDPQVVD
ncbi:hypothetical protein [Streptomyces sp. NPDC056821]|uniref:hypothetical protein n=1 Tax=unclassified Streptomyces TaxID=2593676 RepID=UPI003687076A